MGIGMMPSLLLGTIAGSASHLSLAWLSESGGGHFWINLGGEPVPFVADFLHPLGYRTASEAASQNRRDKAE
jgi:hypothetical protein